MQLVLWDNAPVILKCLVFRIVLPVLFFVSACQTSPDSSQPENAESAPTEQTYLNLDSDASYVGIDVCKTCHVAQYDTFIQAEMGRSFRSATLSNSDANFEDPSPVFDEASNLHYLPYHDGEDLFIMEYQLSGSDTSSRRDTVYKRIEKIDFIVGSGQHTNSHIMDENGYLYQMPLTWYAQDGKWDLPPRFDEGNNFRFSRPIPQQCMGCHNAMPVFVEGSENRFKKVPPGIDCERCHGPGSFHVTEMQAGRVVSTADAIDYSIVNPAKLPVDQQFDICQNCHLQGVSVFKPGKTALDFRPGRNMTDIQNVFMPRYADSVEVFKMASHPDRLKMSSCFRESQAAADEYEPLTCVTCHDPHVSIKVLGPDVYNEACQSCHTPASDDLCTEEEAVRALSGNNCISCHMPVSGSEDIPHVRITDHFIRVVESDAPPILTPEEMAAQKRFIGLASLVEDSPSPRDIAEGYLGYYEEVTNDPVFLDSALVYLKMAEKDQSREELAQLWIWAWFWRGDQELIVNLANSIDEKLIPDGWTFYRIGEASLAMGQPKEAVHYLELAVNRSPEHLRFRNKLASAYMNDGQLDRALETYDDVLKANPKFEISYNDRGYTRLQMGDFSGAELDFLAALSMDPNASKSLANLASLYFNTNRKSESIPYMRRLLELEPNNSEYQRLWELLSE